MSNKTYCVDYVRGRVLMPDEMKRIFSVSNHNAPLPLFLDTNLIDLAVYIAWKSSIELYYPEITINETPAFRLWAMEPYSMHKEIPKLLLPRAAVVSIAVFPEARKLAEQNTQKSHYELFRWFFENLSTILPQYDLPSWLCSEGEISGISIGQEYFWHSLDDVFHNFIPIYNGENEKRHYLGWLRKEQVAIFKLCVAPCAIEAMLDAPASCDTEEGITLFMEAFYESTPALHHIMSLTTQEGRLAYSSWFLTNQASIYGVTEWAWNCLMQPCSLDDSGQALPKGVAGIFFITCPSFKRWEQLAVGERRKFLAIFMSEIAPLLQEKSVPKQLATFLSIPASECLHANECGVGLLQQSLWEREFGSILSSYDDCIACITWYIRSYGNTLLFALSDYRQIVRWDTLMLLSEPNLPEAARTFLQQRERNSVTVLGWPDGLLGIGTDSRMTVETLEQVGVCVHQASVSYLLPFGGSPWPLAKAPEREPRSLCSIVCLAAQDVYRLWLATPQSWWTGRYNIGLCPWELPLWPKSAGFAVEMLDEVWAPSKFIAHAFTECGKPVTHIPHTVIPPEPEGDLRAQLGINPETVVFLTSYDSNASCMRKNPLAVIDAFNKAFAGTKHDVKLIVKTMNATNHCSAWQELHDKNQCGNKVIFINKAYPLKQHARLLNTCDAFVSLHRSEGFGRLLAEAMSMGKLLICSNFGGNTDFALKTTACLVDGTLIPVLEKEYIFARGQRWFNANRETAAEFMRDFYVNPSKYKMMRKNGKSLILTEHSLEAAGIRMRDALRKAGTAI